VVLGELGNYSLWGVDLRHCVGVFGWFLGGFGWFLGGFWVFFLGS
jgi:hypothetical protein